MKYIFCLLAFLLALSASAQKPARRGRNVQQVVIDTSRWGFVKIAPAPRAQPVPLVFNPAKPDTTSGMITPKDTIAATVPTTATATADISPLASLIAKNDSALAATKPATAPVANTVTSSRVAPTPPVPSTVVASAKPEPTLDTPTPVAAPPPAVAEKKPIPRPATVKPATSVPNSTSAGAVLLATPTSGSVAAAKPTAAAPKPTPAPVVSVTKPVPTSSLSVSAPAPTPPVSTTSATVSVPTTPQPVAAASTSAATRTDAPAKLTFAERFDDNHNFWSDGTIDGYTYELAPFYNSYFIRREAGKRSSKPGLTFVALPADIDLNRAESFTLSVDIIVPKDSPFDGGLMFGALNDKNYCHFQLRGEKEASIKWVVNGGNMASYMPGTYLPTGKLIQPLRNTLRVVKEKDQLHFFINDRELQESPYDFRQFRGNKVGFISSGDAVKFQNLTVVVSPAH